MSKWLFFDDRYFNVNRGFERKPEHATLIGDSVYVDPARRFVSLAWGYPFVHYNTILQKYVMYYQGWSIDRTVIENTLPLAASSADGLHFEPLDMRPYLKESPIAFNQILPYRLGDFVFAEGQFFHFESFGKTPYVALCMYKRVSNDFLAATFVSEDGLTFRYDPEMAWHKGLDSPDYPMSVIYEESAATYSIYRRPRHTDRRIALSTTKDFKTYTEAELILQPDCMDPSMSDFYGLTVLPSVETRVGFLMVYETPNYLKFGSQRASGLAGHKFYGGSVQPQLVYSDDGRYFNRSFRTSFLTSPEQNIPCVYPTCVVAQDSRWLIYASMTSEEHGYTTPEKGQLVTYAMRPDGFVSMRTFAGYGELITKQFLYSGGELSFNLSCVEGEAAIQIADSDNNPIEGFTYDDCIPFRGDELNHVFSFRHADLTALTGRILVLGFRGRNIRWYSMMGKIAKVTPYQAMKYEHR